MTRGAKRVLLGILVILLAGAAGTAALVASNDGLRWRAEVLARKATGDLDGIGWMELISMLGPGSRYWLQSLADGYSPHSAILNPYDTPADVEAGGKRFNSYCAGCHEGHGGAGAPDLGRVSYRHGDSDWAIYNVIRHGVDGTAMTGFDFTERERWQVVAYLRRLQQVAAPGESEERPPLVVTPTDIRAGTAAGGWPTYSGGYDGQRYSPLEEVNRSNVDRLGIEWVLQIDTEDRTSESTPVVAGDTMFLTAPPDLDLAVDASDGKLLWSARREVDADARYCCGPFNRGMAVLGDKVYRGTLDGFLIARDARTGKLRWEVEVGSAADGYSITAAPLAVDDMIVTGVAGGEYGIRGYLDAYDAATGERRWRTYTIPAAGEPGNDSWAGDSWRTGGAPTWMTGAYDPELRLLYWGVGNPAPDFDGSTREGDNLYTNSVIAVDVDTGELRWHFQFTPHDVHDWDANQVPVLVDATLDGEPRRLLLTATKNGFGYVLDRVTGEFIAAHEVVPQTWADAIDDEGRPIRRPGSEPSDEGTFVKPGTGGGANWWPPSYNRVTNLIHYSLLESASVFHRSDDEFETGEMFVGSTGRRIPGSRHTTAIKAYRAGTGELAWKFEMPPREDWAQIGGTLTTGGELVCFGDRDGFYVLDARTGGLLWHRNLGAPIHAAPITYSSGGKQRIAVVAGRSLYALSLP